MITEVTPQAQWKTSEHNEDFTLKMWKIQINMTEKALFVEKEHSAFNQNAFKNAV